MVAGDFDLKALYAALDNQRQARGLTWARVRLEINAVGPEVSLRPIAMSTITSLRTKSLAEGAGVLQMLRWLNRAPESFMRGLSADLAGARLPDAERHKVMRFDTRKLYEALDGARKSRAMTWQQVEAETGVAASRAKGLARGGLTAFPGVTRLTRWLRRPVSDFIRLSPYWRLAIVGTVVGVLQVALAVQLMLTALRPYPKTYRLLLQLVAFESAPYRRLRTAKKNAVDQPHIRIPVSASTPPTSRQSDGRTRSP